MDEILIAVRESQGMHYQKRSPIGKAYYYL